MTKVKKAFDKLTDRINKEKNQKGIFFSKFEFIFNYFKILRRRLK
jgi:hypothetical protein